MFTACDITRFLPSFEETTSSESVPEITTPEETTPVPHAHVEVIDPAVAPTCARTGRTEGKHCSVCGEVLVAQKVISVLGHTETLDPAVAPTCADEGKTEGKHCLVCNKILVAQQTIPALGHKYVSTVTPPATSGDVVAKYTCSVCGDSYTQTIQLVDFTVTEDNRGVIGYTGKTGENLDIPAVFQNNGVWYRVTAIGDRAFDGCENLTSVTIPNTVKGIGKWAFHWCTNLTRITLPNSIKSMALSSLRSCDSLKTITFDGTKNEWDSITKDDSWDLFTRGYVIFCTDGNICEECVEVIDPAVAATCAATGLTEGKHCSVCDKVIVAQNIIPALGHIEIVTPAISATCTTSGKTEGKTCLRCKEILAVRETIPALGHAEVTNSAVAPTCTETGLTEGKYCTVCEKILVTQEIVKALGHTEVVIEGQFPTYTEPGLTDSVYCSVCRVVLSEQKTIPALGYYTNPELYNDDYGYQYLGTMNNGTAMQDLYEMIDEASLSFHTDATVDAIDNVVGKFDFASLGLTENEAISVWITYKNDHPLYYWISTSVTIEGTDLLLLTEDAYANGTDRATYNELVYDAIAKYASEVAGETSSYRIALAFHDAIIYAIDYAYEDDGYTPQDDIWAHNILGVFEKQSGVCEAYARTFQLLLNCMGVENVFVTGESNGEDHAWNLVQMDDGNWYWFDLTWNDTPNWMWGIRYNYFCVNDSQNVAWSDGGWNNPETSFLETHTLSLPTDQGAYFLYGLPIRPSTIYDTENLLLRETFEVYGFNYAFVGHNAVALVSSTLPGDVVIPEKVTYNGVTYEVIAIGRMYWGLFDASTNVFEAANSVTIPKTIRFIWDRALHFGPLENIWVDEENPYFTSQDGVLFTKDLHVLIRYPLANKRTSYTIPDEVFYIADDAFNDCVIDDKVYTHLEELTLGANVQAFGMGNWGYGYDKSTVFITGQFPGIYDTMTGAKRILVDKNNRSFKIHDNIIYSYDHSYLFFALEKDTLTNVTILDGVQVIENDAFMNCNQLTSITLPDSVVKIGTYAFWECTSLACITLGEGVQFIDQNAFGNCNRLYEIYNLSKHITITAGTVDYGYIGLYALAIHTSMDESSKIFTDENGYIFFEDNNANYHLICYTGNETELLLPTNCNGKNYVINQRAFCECSNLTSVTIPTGVISIGQSAFARCNNLVSITLSNSVVTIGSAAFGGCSSLVNITIPSSVTSIGDGSFEGCSNLVSITIPNGITSIGYSMFYGCSSLTSITIPNSVTSIEQWAFSNCDALTSLSLPNSVTHIGFGAFQWCHGLTNLTLPSSVISIGAEAFRGCNGLIQIENGVSYVGKWIVDCDASVTTVSIREGTIGISEWAFVHSGNLTNITIPDSIVHIDLGAFRGCTGLVEIIVSENNPIFKSLDGNLFTKDGTRLIKYANGKDNTSYILPDGVKSIDPYAFEGCNALTSIVIPNGVTTIGDWAFQYCSALISIALPDSVTILGNYAFEECGNLTSASLGNGITSIGEAAFINCKNLSNITIPASVTKIGWAAFAHCYSLMNVTFENTSGWWLANHSNATSGKPVSSDDLASTYWASVYLSNWYYSSYWTRS